jgi:hypothetical protein
MAGQWTGVVQGGVVTHGARAGQGNSHKEEQ